MIKDNVLKQAKQKALKLNVSLSKVVEDALRIALGARHTRKNQLRKRIPISRKRGGVLPGVDLNSNADLLNLMEG